MYKGMLYFLNYSLFLASKKSMNTFGGNAGLKNVITKMFADFKVIEKCSKGLWQVKNPHFKEIFGIGVLQQYGTT